MLAIKLHISGFFPTFFLRWFETNRLKTSVDLWQLTVGDETTWLSAIGVAIKILALIYEYQRGLTHNQRLQKLLPHAMSNCPAAKGNLWAFRKRLASKGRGAVGVLSWKFSLFNCFQPLALTVFDLLEYILISIESEENIRVRERLAISTNQQSKMPE